MKTITQKWKAVLSLCSDQKQIQLLSPPCVHLLVFSSLCPQRAGRTDWGTPVNTGGAAAHSSLQNILCAPAFLQNIVFLKVFLFQNNILWLYHYPTFSFCTVYMKYFLCTALSPKYSFFSSKFFLLKIIFFGYIYPTFFALIFPQNILCPLFFLQKIHKYCFCYPRYSLCTVFCLKIFVGHSFYPRSSLFSLFPNIQYCGGCLLYEDFFCCNFKEHFL